MICQSAVSVCGRSRLSTWFLKPICESANLLFQFVADELVGVLAAFVAAPHNGNIPRISSNNRMKERSMDEEQKNAKKTNAKQKKNTTMNLRKNAKTNEEQKK